MDVYSDRPGHLIGRVEIAGWLGNSVVDFVTFHRTSVSARREIFSRGVRVDAAQVGTFGLGFYSATVSDPFYGEVEIAVAVRLRNPLIGTADDMGDLVDHLAWRFSPLDPRINRDVGHRIQEEIMSSGHDGMIIRDAVGDGVDWVVVFEDEAVRVVVDW